MGVHVWQWLCGWQSFLKEGAPVEAGRSEQAVEGWLHGRSALAGLVQEGQEAPLADGHLQLGLAHLLVAGEEEVLGHQPVNFPG